MDERTCSIDRCSRTDVVGYDGLCRKHYGRKRKHGTTELRERWPKFTCSVPDCDEPAKTRRLCKAHYSRLLKTGSVQADKPVRKIFREVGDSKPCSVCGITKPLDDFSPDTRRRDGKQASCRECANARHKQWREDEREHYLELKRAESQRRKPQTRAYRLANKERLRVQRLAWEASLAGDQLDAHREAHRRAAETYRAKNADLCNERIRAWKKANPDKASESVNRRRAWKHGNGPLEKFTRTEIGDRDGWICGICEMPVDKTLQFPDQQSPSLDHVVPLSLGGEHSRANSRISHWICNVRRGAERLEAS